MDEIRVKTGVYAAICRVKADLATKGGIGKNNQAPEKAGGYNFRGIDDVYNLLCGLCAQHGLVMMPRIVDRTIEFQTNKHGNIQTHVFLLVDVTFTSSEDGSSCVGTFLGEAIDTGDKASNKAMSAAFKYAHIQAFQVPTYEGDDTEAHVVEVAKPAPKKKSVTEQVGLRPPANDANEVGESMLLQPKAKHAASFAELHEVAKKLEVSSANVDPVMWATVRNRCHELILACTSRAEVRSSMALVKALGSPELLTKAANEKFTSLPDIRS